MCLWYFVHLSVVDRSCVSGCIGHLSVVYWFCVGSILFECRRNIHHTLAIYRSSLGSISVNVSVIYRSCVGGVLVMCQ